MGGGDTHHTNDNKKKRNGGAHIWRGEWRASRNGGWEGEFGGVCKIESCLEALLEMDFSTKPLNFGVEAHIEAPARDALTAIDQQKGGEGITYAVRGQSPQNTLPFYRHKHV
jgi:hypothetical protein